MWSNILNVLGQDKETDYYNRMSKLKPHMSQESALITSVRDKGSSIERKGK